MRSLKGTLYRGVILGAAVVLLVAGTILYLLVNRQLIHQLDETLTDKALMLALSVEEKHYGLEVDIEEMRTEDMEEAESPEYLHIGFLDGRTIHRSEALENVNIIAFPGPVLEPIHQWYRLPDGTRLRSVLFSFTPEVDLEEEDLESVARDTGIIVDTMAAHGDHIVIQLFKDTEQHSRFMEIFLLMLIATGLGSIGVLSFTVWQTIKRGAEPINKLASSIEHISDDDLAIRLDEVAVLEELAPIVHKFNLFLERLEKGFNRERGFTSDAAHELRTPLAGLKSTIEVALAKRRDGEEYRETLESALDIVKQLENLVNSLLALARLESGQETVKGSEVSLERCIRDAWKACNEDAEEKQVAASFDLTNGTLATIDRNLFSQVLDEIFRNAVYYVDRGGTIRIGLDSHKGNTRIWVSNTGSKVSAVEAGRVFDRFWNRSRSIRSGSFGLRQN